MDEHELLTRLRGGENDAQRAFDTLFRATYEWLVRFAGALVREQAIAEEVVQDVFFELWRRRETIDFAGSPNAYLARAVRNRALNHLRHLRVAQRNAAQAPPELASRQSASGDAEGAELDAVIRDTLASLPPRCNQVFVLSRQEGLKYAEIAERLGLSVKTVEAHMARALREFRERLAPWLPTGDRL